MQRTNISELKNVDSTNFFRDQDGTSVMYLAYNPHNGRTGVLKQNGCVLGIENEDLREKLASIILNLCGVKTANIELMQDDAGKHYCFSYNVLGENEEHIKLNTPIINEEDSKEKIFLDYMNNIFSSIASLPGINEQQYNEIRKRFLQIHFMDLILDHYDRKMQNCKIIHNKITNEYKPPIGYDYGVAFSPDAMQKYGIFMYLTNEEVMDFLLKYYYEDLKTTIDNVFGILTDENINIMLNNEEYKELNPKLIGTQLKYRVNQLQELIFARETQEQVPLM